MKMEVKYVKRRRATGLIVGAIVAYVLWQISSNLWWSGSGYCWGTMAKCVGL